MNQRIHQVMFTGLVISSWTESCSTAGGLSLVKDFVQFRSDDGETPGFLPPVGLAASVQGGPLKTWPWNAAGQGAKGAITPLFLSWSGCQF